jgi:hypothetical protein
MFAGGGIETFRLRHRCPPTPPPPTITTHSRTWNSSTRMSSDDLPVHTTRPTARMSAARSSWLLLTLMASTVAVTRVGGRVALSSSSLPRGGRRERGGGGIDTCTQQESEQEVYIHVMIYFLQRTCTHMCVKESCAGGQDEHQSDPCSAPQINRDLTHKAGNPINAYMPLPIVCVCTNARSLAPTPPPPNTDTH